MQGCIVAVAIVPVGVRAFSDHLFQKQRYERHNAELLRISEEGTSAKMVKAEEAARRKMRRRAKGRTGSMASCAHTSGRAHENVLDNVPAVSVS